MTARAHRLHPRVEAVLEYFGLREREDAGRRRVDWWLLTLPPCLASPPARRWRVRPLWVWAPPYRSCSLRELSTACAATRHLCAKAANIAEPRGGMSEWLKETGCKPLALLRRFESCSLHSRRPAPQGVGLRRFCGVACALWKARARIPPAASTLAAAPLAPHPPGRAGAQRRAPRAARRHVGADGLGTIFAAGLVRFGALLVQLGNASQEDRDRENERRALTLRARVGGRTIPSRARAPQRSGLQLVWMGGRAWTPDGKSSHGPASAA